MIRLLSGDCRDILVTLPAESVHTVVTSPPYYGLRDYGTALWDGGDAGCDHGSAYRKRRNEQRGGDCGDGGIRRSERDPQAGQCSCGAVRVDRQIGLEATPDEYLATMVAVFREVRRVLRADGTCWVNMGDSYNNRTKVRTSSHQPSLNNFVDDNWAERAARGGVRMSINDGVIKEKDLLLMPARLALALQADGWWVRSAIVWAKPNPMPESVTDRPTSAYEMVYLLTKSARYFYDADAVREDITSEFSIARNQSTPRNFGEKAEQSLNRSDRGRYATISTEAGRNLRNVWSIATHAYPEAHFATFPPELAERCIKAGTSERGACAACGKPWVRVTERINGTRTRLSGIGVDCDAGTAGRAGEPETTTTGWSPGCQCHGHFEERPAAPDWISDETGERKMVRVWVPDGDAPPPVPCTVLDPFIGAGTTALVADRLQRDCIGIDLNTQYTRMAMDRCIADAPLFTSFPPAEPPEDERQKELFLGPEYGA